MSDSVEPGTTGVAVPPQTRAQAELRRNPRRCRTPAAGDSGTASLSPASGARWCSRACRSRRPCSLAPGSSRGSSGASPAAIGYGVGVVLAVVVRAFADRDVRPAKPLDLAHQPDRRRRAARRVLRARPVLAAPDPRPDGGDGVQRRAVVLSPLVALGVFALLLLIGRGLRALYRRLGAAAATLDRPPRGQRRRLDRRGRADLPGDQRRAPRRVGERRQRDVRAPRHDHAGGRAAADHRPEVRRHRFAHPLGHARLAGPDVHRHRARPRTRSRARCTAPPRSPSAPTRAWRRPRTPRRAPASPSTTSSTPAVSSAPTCSSPAPPAAAGSTPRPPTPSSTSPAATRPSSACSTPTCRPGCPTWSTSQGAARPAAPSSTPSTRSGQRCRPGAVRGSSSPARAWARSAARRRSAARPTCATAPPARSSPGRRTSTPCSPSSASTGRRQPGDPPVYKGGRTVRFTNDATAGIPPEGQPWDGQPRPLPHAPLRPDRLVEPATCCSPSPTGPGEPPGKDVLGRLHWLPVVTFWQVTADLTFAGGVPQGHGHNYRGEYVGRLVRGPAARRCHPRPADRAAHHGGRRPLIPDLGPRTEAQRGPST